MISGVYPTLRSGVSKMMQSRIRLRLALRFGEKPIDRPQPIISTPQNNVDSVTSSSLRDDIVPHAFKGPLCDVAIEQACHLKLLPELFALLFGLIFLINFSAKNFNWSAYCGVCDAPCAKLECNPEHKGSSLRDNNFLGSPVSCLHFSITY